MERTVVKYLEKPKLRKPVLIEGLPGIGNVGRISAGYLVTELKAKKFAELYSPHFLPLVVIQPGGVARLLKGEFYYYKGSKRDLIILVGDSQSITPQGYYEISGKIIDVAKEMKVSEIITLGGLGVEKIVKSPRIIGAANNEKLVRKYSKYGIVFDDTVAANIIGISGLLLGLAEIENIDAVCMLAETQGFPLVIADPIAADTMLRVLSKILNLKIDLSKLDAEARELEEKIRKTEELQKQMLEKLEKEEKTQLQYIG